MRLTSEVSTHLLSSSFPVLPQFRFPLVILLFLSDIELFYSSPCMVFLFTDFIKGFISVLFEALGMCLIAILKCLSCASAPWRTVAGFWWRPIVAGADGCVLAMSSSHLGLG